MSVRLNGIEKMSVTQRYQYLLSLVKGQFATETDAIALLSNTSAIIKALVSDLNWVGFYFVQGNELVLGPFQGLPACTRLHKDTGVCAKAWREKTFVRVDNVERFPGHVACDGASKSELVFPLMNGNEVYAVLDLDSPLVDRFTELEERYFLELVTYIQGRIVWKQSV